MGLSGALFSSVSGLDATGTAISVIGDNIANVNTPGFKARRAEFVDVLGQSITAGGGFSQIGAGTNLSRISPLFSQGSFESTARTTDLAIEGRGFFILEGQQGRVYTRAGLFNFDRDGLLVNPQGLPVQGFAIDPTTLQPFGQVGNIQLNAALSPPRASTSVSLSVNLDPNDIAGTTSPFSASDPNGTSNFNTVLSLYDSLGNQHQATVYYSNVGGNSWDWTITVPPGDTNDAPATAGDPVVVQGSGTLTFDADGILTAVTGSPATFNFTGGGVQGQTVDIAFGPIAGIGLGSPSTQVATSNATNSFQQDGFAPGQLQSITIDPEGFVTGSFSNGETIPLAQIALANFANVEGLVSIGNNNLLESRASGQPLVGGPQTSSLGTIRSSSLEQSTVDLAAEFVRLIINQRAFQANTRTVSTTNELLANLVTLGQ